MRTRGPKQLRGFAVMSPEQRSRIARMGGKAAHEKGTAHEWDSYEARLAGRKGGHRSRGGRGKLPDQLALVPPAGRLEDDRRAARLRSGWRVEKWV